MARKRRRQDKRNAKRNKNTLLQQPPGDRQLRFEPLEVRLLLASDFGDAPSPYPTTLVNLPPTLDAIADVRIDENDSGETVYLTGISDGDGESEPLKVTATSDNFALIGNVDVAIGSSSYGDPIQFVAGTTTHGVTTGDFDGDGNLDTAVGNQHSGSATIVFGDGLGGFSQPVSVGMGTQPYDVVAGDFDADGYDDLVASNFENNLITIRRGSADRSFSGSQSYATGDGPSAYTWTGAWELETADFNNDGKLDIVVGNQRHDLVSVLLGNGSGGFGEPIKSETLGVGGYSGSLYGFAVGDFDQDGNTDIAASIARGNVVKVLRGNGDGTLTLAGTYTVGGPTGEIAAGDFDADGAIDLAVVIRADDHTLITPLWGNGSGGFVADTALEFQYGGWAIDSGDVDGDGDDDLVFGGPGFAGRIYHLTSNGNRTFEHSNTLVIDDEGALNSEDLQLADMNNDGVLDVASSGYHYGRTGTVVVFISTGTSFDYELIFTPVADQHGTATITVTVEDGGLDNNLVTPGDNATFSRDFAVTVEAKSELSTRIYWADGKSIYRSLSDGSGLEAVVTNTGNMGRMEFDIDSSTGRLITASFSVPDQNDGSWIHSSNLDGSDRTIVRDTGWPLGVVPHAIAVNPQNSDIFYSPHVLEDYVPSNRECFCPGGMQLLSSDGSSLTTFSQRPWYVEDIQVDPNNGHVYYTVHPTFGGGPTGFAGIRRMNLDGSNDVSIVNTGGSSYLALDLEGEHIYYGENTLGDENDNQTIYRANFDGSDIQTIIADTGYYIGDIDFDPVYQKLIWSASEGTSSVIQQSDLDGNNLEVLFDIGTGTVPIALEHLSTQPPAGNQPPTLDTIADVTIDEDAPEQTVGLTGITAGGGESQLLRVTPTSNNPELIPHPTVDYTTASSTGSFTFTPLPDQSGTATITVTVEDGGLDNDLSTPGDNASFSQTFDVTVNPVNDDPTLDPVNENLPINSWDQLGSDIDGEAAVDSSGRNVSLSADGSTVAIGAYNNDGNGTDSGHVRIYRWTDGSWNQLGSDIDGEAAGDRTGYGVSLSADGSTVAIGAYDNDGNGIYSGHVRIYRWTDGSWNQLGSDIDGEAAGDTSGYGVSLSADGSTVAIGAFGNDGNGSNSGHVRIYRWTDGSWNQLGSDIDGEAAVDNSGYGVSLSADGSTVAIGAPGNDGNGSHSGHVRIYRWTDGSWNQLGSDIDGEAAVDGSGRNVSLSADGSTVAIGAPWNDGNGSNSGHVRIYRWTDGSWDQLGSDIDGEAAGDTSGRNVSLSADGSTVAIGAYNNDGNGSNSGHVRIYRWTDGSWDQLGSDIDGEAAVDLSGHSVSLSADGSTVAIGAPWNDGNGSNSGHVRIYRGTSEAAFLAINENAAEQTVGLTGITAGGGETQPLRVTATSDNPGLISNPAVAYTSAASAGSLSFTPVPDANGNATITVTVEDGGLDNNLVTPGDNATTSRTFGVTVLPDEVQEDFGDAPVPYPVTLAENGARHTATGPTLGATRDTEADGTHSAAADADGADEDGVTFGVIQVGALDATTTVNVQNASGGAKLDGWMDFNADGNWGGPGEQIFHNVSLNGGDNTLQFDVPSWAVDGNTFARFRLSTIGGLGVTGSASDGEVEDYQVTIHSPGASVGLFSGQNVISSTTGGAFSVFAADVDGDGDMDALSASFLDDKIAWHENDGSQNFTEHTISTAADGAWSVFAADLDGDGDLDVLSASRNDSKIAWYENDGSQAFTVHTISTGALGAVSVSAADVDGDGDLDVLSASHLDDTIAWYENDGSQGFTPHVISLSAGGARSVFAADVDRDGDMDVLSASSSDDKVAWYENDGSQAFTEHTISVTADGAFSVFVADVDDDGDMDVLSASFDDDRITWYENDGSQGFTAHTISVAADGAYGVFAADIDGDGDVDVLSASDNDNKIAWYENDGSQGFTDHTISTVAHGAFTALVADVNGDGHSDVLSASFNDNKIAWYENVTPPPPNVTLVTRESGTAGFDWFHLLDTLAFTFDTEVNVTAAALSLSNTTAGGTPVDLTGIVFSYDAGTMTARWDFSGVAPVDAAFYTAVLDASLITNSYGRPLDGNGDGTAGDDFSHVLLVAERGDTDVDGDVDLSDFNRLATNFDPAGINPPYEWCDGNTDGDLDVDLSDFVTLAGNFAPAGYAGTTPSLYVAPGCGSGSEPLAAASLAGATDDDTATEPPRVLRIDVPTNGLLATSPTRILSHTPGAQRPRDMQTRLTVGQPVRQEAVSEAFAQYEQDRRAFGTADSSDSSDDSEERPFEETLQQDETEHLDKAFAEQNDQ